MQIANASSSPVASLNLIESTWLCEIPYPGSSSECMIPFTPALLAAPESSLPRRGSWTSPGPIFFEPRWPARPSRGMANTPWPDSRAEAIIFESIPSSSSLMSVIPPARICSTLDLISASVSSSSNLLSSGSKGYPCADLSLFDRRKKYSCLAISILMILGIQAKSWHPLISTLSPHAMLTLRSCRMLPRPLRTRRVSRRRPPRYLETASACSGEAMSGSVAISTSGIPSLSKEYVTSCPSEFVSSPSFLAESSSRQITDIPTSMPSTSNFPSVATSVVRWNPLVFEPSTTVFLITWR